MQIDVNAAATHRRSTDATEIWNALGEFHRVDAHGHPLAWQRRRGLRNCLFDYLRNTRVVELAHDRSRCRRGSVQAELIKESRRGSAASEALSENRLGLVRELRVVMPKRLIDWDDRHQRLRRPDLRRCDCP